jgi:hypothetical protein
MKASKLLLVLPLLLLCGFAVFFQNKEKQQAIENKKPFKIFFEETKIVSSVGTNNTWRIDIRTYINCEGRRPAWWGKASVYFSVLQSHFSSKGKKYRQASNSGAGSGWSEKHGRYFLSSVFNAGKPRSQLQPADFVATVNFQDDVLIRKFRVTLPIGNDTQPFEEDDMTWAMNQ